LAAADVVLVANHLRNFGVHLVTAMACLNVHNLAQRSSLEAGSTREKKAHMDRVV
jgi:hypothetical protein